MQPVSIFHCFLMASVLFIICWNFLNRSGAVINVLLAALIKLILSPGANGFVGGGGIYMFDAVFQFSSKEHSPWHVHDVKQHW